MKLTIVLILSLLFPALSNEMFSSASKVDSILPESVKSESKIHIDGDISPSEPVMVTLECKESANLEKIEQKMQLQGAENVYRAKYAPLYRSQI
jgi:hypothetical protein